jgi:hypothetical protein
MLLLVHLTILLNESRFSPCPIRYVFIVTIILNLWPPYIHDVNKERLNRQRGIDGGKTCLPTFGTTSVLS